MKTKNKIESEFIPYEEALALKELGFDEKCFRFKNNISDINEEKGWLNWNEVEKFVSLPLYQQAFRWFRVEHNLRSAVIPHWLGTDFMFIIEGKLSLDDKGVIILYKTNEEAELECLRNLIKIKNGK